MRQWSFRQKMALIGLIFSIPVALLAVLLYMQVDDQIGFFRLERVGVAFTKTLRPLFADLEAYRMSPGDAPSRAAIETQIDADFAAAVAAEAGPARMLGIRRPVSELRAAWTMYADANATLESLGVLLGLVSDNSKITLDPYLDGYYVGDTMLSKMPIIADRIAQASEIGTHWLQTGRLSVGERVTMTMLAGEIRAARRGMDHNVPIVIGQAPYLQAQLDPLFGTARETIIAFSSSIESDLLKATAPQGSPVSLIARRNAAIRASLALYDGSISAMDEVLERRIDAAHHSELTVLAIVLVAIVAAGGLMLATTRSMARQIADKVALEHEILERVEVEKRLAFAAFHDELTGLSNRALLMDRLEQIVVKRHEGAHLWAILFMDLDRFKVVNDSLGHHSGDLVLIEAARRLGECLRAGDTLARLGGDEFVILLEGIDDVSEAYAVARRVLHAFESPMTIATREVFTSASIGIALGRADEETAEDVLRNADMAMYRAKSRGKQRYELFTPELLTTAVARLELETDLARALERHEFSLYYQPIVALHDGRLTGFEALVRWLHPRRGIVAPDEFIALAEENGAIVAIGEWILREACRQLRLWYATVPAARDLSMNVNVSGTQLTAPGFSQIVESALHDSGLSAGAINVEITESVLLMDDAGGAKATLAELRGLGVRLHLDDFGTGYSSLAYLRDFHIDALKIDRSFVSGAGAGRDGAVLASVEIVRTVVALAQSLKLTVTAEGVETNDQGKLLRALGCTTAQGYYYARPLDAQAASALIVAYGKVSTELAVGA